MAFLSTLRSAVIARRGYHGLSRRAANAYRWARHANITAALRGVIRAAADADADGLDYSDRVIFPSPAAIRQFAAWQHWGDDRDDNQALARAYAGALEALRGALANPPPMADIRRVLAAQYAGR